VTTILIIARDGIRALLHRRLLVALMVASIIMTIGFSALFSQVRSNMSDGLDQQMEAELEKSGKDMSEADKQQMREAMESVAFGFQTAFYFVASLGGSVVALFIFGTAVSSEIRSGTIRITLAKPVSRTQFLLGKYLGAVAVMAGYTLIASAALLAFVHVQKIELSPGMTYAPWLMFCQQLMLGSVALLLSMFMHPVIGAVIAFFAGNGLTSPPNPLYYLLPSYKAFDLYGEVMSGTLIGLAEVGWLTLYAFDIVALMLLLALWRFRRKELV
jgi:Cu-processing system permease protein